MITKLVLPILVSIAAKMGWGIEVEGRRIHLRADGHFVGNWMDRWNTVLGFVMLGKGRN